MARIESDVVGGATRSSEEAYWKNFTVECKCGKLVCAFVPQAFQNAFEERFEDYLLTPKSTERSQAEQAAVFLFSGAAGTQFLGLLRKILEEALRLVFETSCEYPKHLYANTRMAKRILENRPATTGIIAEGDSSRIEFPEVEARDPVRVLLKQLEKSLRDLFAATHGGPRRRPTYDWNDGGRFRVRVDELRPLWQCIINFFQKNEFDSGCPEMIKKHSEFVRLSKGCNVPDDLITEVFKRKAESGWEVWPLAFALRHAANELAIVKSDGRPFALYTLKKYYKIRWK